MRVPPPPAEPADPDALAVLAAYSEGVVANGGRAPQTSPMMLAVAGRVARWCRERGVDPRRYTLDRLRMARRVIVLKQVPSDKFLDSHRRIGDGRVAEADGQAALSRAAVEDDPTGRDGELVPVAEAVKARLGLDREVCRASARDITLGWHPASPHCQTCPLAAPCRADRAARGRSLAQR